MKNEVIKQAFKLGNSAGVLLPIEWKGRKVAVKLIDRSISQEMFEILEEQGLLKNVVGIFLAGSYARGEEKEGSDIDIIVITDIINKQIKIGKYEIVFISREKIDKSIKTSLYLISLLKESKAILNINLLEEYKRKIKGISVGKHIREIESITRINDEAVNISEELKENVPDETLYSVILRLRELYLIECLNNNKNPSNKELLSLIKKFAGEEAYNAYIRIKNDLKPRKVVSVEETRALLNEIRKRIKVLEHGKEN